MKSLKLVLLSSCVLVFSGCDDSNYLPEKKTRKYVLDETLKDCSITEIKSSTEDNLTIVRCPLSSTTTNYTENCGKNCTDNISNTVIDENKKKEYVEINGVKYEKVEVE